MWHVAVLDGRQRHAEHSHIRQTDRRRWHRPRQSDTVDCPPGHDGAHRDRRGAILWPTSLKVIGTHMLNFKPNFKCSSLKFFWGPLPLVVASLGQTLAHEKIWRASTPKGRNILSGKKSTWLGWVQTHMYWYYFLESGPMFTRLASPNAGGIILDHVSFRFWISWLVPKIFKIKVGSCVKSTQILWRIKFLGRAPEFLDLLNIKRTQIVIMWQSFLVIGQGSSDILWRIK